MFQRVSILGFEDSRFRLGRWVFVCLLCIMPILVMAQGVNGELATDAQTQGIISYVQHVMGFNKAVPQEKVYMHFDNTGYF